MAVAEIHPERTRVYPVDDRSSVLRPVFLSLFMISLMMPVVLYFGPFAMAPSRLFVLLAFFPVLGLWISGSAGRFRAMDFALLFAASWAALSVLKVHGIGAAYERAGFIFLEMVGGYFFGRTIIRSSKDFLTYLKFAMVALIFMLPLAILETQTGTPLLIEVLSRVIETEPNVETERRLGLDRAQVVFSHPILYGVFCAAMLGPVVRGLNYGAGTFRSLARIGIILGNTICSVSSGAWLMFLVQAAFLAYDRILRSLKNRWKLWFLGVAALYLFIEVAANSSPFRVFVRYFTLNSASGYYRIAQFDAALVNVFNNPFFGRAFTGWIRPRWMIPSIDNYWMVLTVRYGLPMFFVFLGGILWTMFKLSRLKFAEIVTHEIRAGYLIGLGGFLLAAVTVHIWDSTNVWFMFFLGAGMWMFDAEQSKDEDAEKEELAAAAPRGRPAPLRSGSTQEKTGSRKGSAAAKAQPEEPQLAPNRYSRFPVKSRNGARPAPARKGRT